MILVISEEQYYINELVEKEKKNFSIENIVIVDSETDLDVLVINLSTSNLFGIPKLYVFQNPEVFLATKIKNKKYLEILDSIKVNSIDKFIFTWNAENVAKNEFSDYIINNAQVVKTSKVQDRLLPKTIKEIIETKGGTISLEDANYLSQKLNKNLELIASEIEKLLFETKNITKEIIDVSIGDVEQDSNFGFVNSIKSNDFALIYNSYLERKQSGDSVQLLIAQLAQLLILSNRVFSLSRQGLTSKEVSQKLSIHQFRVVKAFELAKTLTISKVRSIIRSLAQIDYDIKAKGVSDEKAFEFFLIKEFAK